MAPVAPGLFSMTTGCPSFSCILWDMIRASESVEPPGGKGTVMVIGLSGKAAKKSATAAAPSTTAKTTLNPKAAWPFPTGEKP